MLEKHNLLGSSLNRLNIAVAATNGGTEVPLVILDRASWTMADEDNASWESTMQSNNTPGSKQSVVNFTHLSESINSLGDKATEAAEIQAKELQKNHVHKSKVLQKTHRHESQEREKIQQYKVLQREKTLEHEALEKKGLWPFAKTEDWWLYCKAQVREAQTSAGIAFVYKQNDLPNKKKKEMTDLFEEKIKQVEEEEIEQDESKMASLLETPQRTNRTPYSAAIVTSCSSI
jgi:hypothetical protein